MTFSIRAATLSDLEPLSALFDAYRQFYKQGADLDCARLFLGDRLGQQDSAIFVAEAPAGQILGFVQLYPAFSSVRTARTYTLNDLFVSAQARKQGIASALLKAAQNYGRENGASRLSLLTTADNTPAIRLYESLGWTRNSQFHQYDLQLA